MLTVAISISQNIDRYEMSKTRITTKNTIQHIKNLFNKPDK